MRIAFEKRNNSWFMDEIPISSTHFNYIKFNAMRFKDLNLPFPTNRTLEAYFEENTYPVDDYFSTNTTHTQKNLEFRYYVEYCGEKFYRLAPARKFFIEVADRSVIEGFCTPPKGERIHGGALAGLD